MGGLKVGDYVSDPTTGGHSSVIAIHPHPEMDIWKFTFDDGASLEVGADHLWAHRLSNRHKPRSKKGQQREYAKAELNAGDCKDRWSSYTIGTTTHLIEKHKAGLAVRIPLSEPLAFTRNLRCEVNPYLLGLLLGDGSLENMNVTNVDPEIQDYLLELGCVRYDAPNGKAPNFTLPKDLRTFFRRYFRNHDLVKARSWEKFIPNNVKFGGVQERLEVLRGLLDTDGCVDQRGRVSFTSTSRRLAEDVQWIARSIGGKAVLRSRKTTFDHKGEKKEGRIAYFVRIWHPKTSSLFKLSRKKARCTDSWNGGAEITRELVSVKYVGKKRAQCITVSSPYGLYVADDFIVTHNTWSLLALAAFRGNIIQVEKARRAGLPPKPVDLMYINHKNYRGLILRPQSTDLEDILDRAEEMYGPTGAVITRGSPPTVTWPKTGAKISFGHFLDDGWKKYVGPEYQFIGIDQIEMMAMEETMHLIAGSCRSKWPELRPLVMSTFNPGGGDTNKGAPGQGWLMEYFRIEAYLDGRAPKYAAIKDEEGKLRMFIPSKVQDNPYFLYTKPELNATKDAIICTSCNGEVPVPMPDRPDEETNVCPLCKGRLLNDGSYLKWLNGIQPESLRRAWRDGDMRALTGMYFKDFRQNGPLAGEPPTAMHVYDPKTVQLEDWFHTWGSIDWGYIHPTDIQFHKKSPWGQIFTFKEISLKRIEPFELGVLIARESKPILEGFRRCGMPAHLNFYMSPDAYAKKQSENTIASQIAAGIKKELGKGSAFLVDFTDHEKELKAAGKSEEAFESMMRRRSEQRDTLITLVPASTDRVAGWMHLQTMLRFTPLRERSVPDKELADQLYQEKGLIAYKQYMNLPEFAESNEVLPRWQISRDCTDLIRAIPRAMHKPGSNDVLKWDATESAIGDDSIDNCRYGLFSEEQQGDSFPPLEQRIDKRVNDIAATMPGLSHHSVTMLREHARYQETSAKTQQNSFGGANRFAARRAMLQQQTDIIKGRPN